MSEGTWTHVDVLAGAEQRHRRRVELGRRPRRAPGARTARALKSSSAWATCVTASVPRRALQVAGGAGAQRRHPPAGRAGDEDRAVAGLGMLLELAEQDLAAAVGGEDEHRLGAVLAGERQAERRRGGRRGSGSCARARRRARRVRSSASWAMTSSTRSPATIEVRSSSAPSKGSSEAACCSSAGDAGRVGGLGRLGRVASVGRGAPQRQHEREASSPRPASTARAARRRAGGRSRARSTGPGRCRRTCATSCRRPAGRPRRSSDSLSSGMPTPVSMTEKPIVAVGSSRADVQRRPSPVWVNLNALESRLRSTCCRRCSSVTSAAGSAWSRSMRELERASARPPAGTRARRPRRGRPAPAARG